ncbi:hypothetical protein ACV35V_37020, partial [Pseudomonas aeruginosa]
CRKAPDLPASKGAQRAPFFLVAARHIRLPFAAKERFAFHFNGRMMRATFLFRRILNHHADFIRSNAT